MERKLAFEYIKSRKKKNLIAIVTVIIVTAFLATICLYGYSFNMMNKNRYIASEGSYHGTIVNVEDKDFSKIQKHSSVKSYGKVIPVYKEESNSENIYYDYLDENSLGYYNLEVIEGVYPKDELHVSIDRLYAEKHNKKIGDSIEGLNKSFNIVGIVDNLKYTRSDENSYKVYMSESFAKSVSNESLALIELNNVNKYAENLESIANLISLNNDNIAYNNTKIEIDNGNFVEVIPFLLIGLLVVLSAFFMIYNIFYILLSERIKSIGLLLTVGITEKQIRKIVLYEAIMLSVFAIPIGIIIGIIATNILISNLYVNGDLRFLIHPVILPVVIFLTLITVVLSVILPAIKVSKLSPIEATRYVEASKEIKKRKNGKESKSFFTDLAKVNMWRNKKSTVITIISMVLSITLFIVSSAILKSMSVENMVNSKLISNVQIDLNYKDIYKGNYIPNEIVDSIKSVDKVKKVTGLKVIPKVINEEKIEPIVGITDMIIKRAEGKVVEGNIDIDEFKRGEVAIVPQMHKNSNYKVGDYIEVKDGSSNIHKIKVIAIISEPVVSLSATPNIVYI